MDVEENKCLTEDDFRKYMGFYLDTRNMTAKDFLKNLLYNDHIRECEHCKEIRNEFMMMLVNTSSEEEFWAKFNEHWQNKEEKDLSDIDIKSSPRR